MLKNSYFLLLIILFINCGETKDANLNIAVASNMQYAIKELSEVFTEKTNIQCNLIISSSGKLTAQIRQDAPYAIFMSANMKYPMDLYESGITKGKPKVYAKGELVLWTMNKHIKQGVLLNDSIKNIAMANPKTAPYGIAALEYLQNKSLYKNLKSKLVYGESISQVNQFVASKSADIGFTSKSVILSSKMKNKGAWVSIDTAYYSEIKQGIVLLKQSKELMEKAEKFKDFLFSKEAKSILEKNGYITF